MLDLTGLGIHLTPLSARAPYFDLMDNGFARKTGWIGQGTGLLAIDRNSDGKISDITELFGEHGAYADGFAALRALDGNGDSVIDAKNAAFSQLRVWVNPEGDGQVHPGELLTLAQLGIVSINLAATASSQVIAGNAIKLTSSYTLADGTTRTIADAWFHDSLTYTQSTTPVALSADVASLPELVRHGSMNGLRAAMKGDPALKSLVAAFAADPGQASLAAVQAIMLEWSGSASVNPSSRGGRVDARQLDFLEKYTGIAFAYTGGTDNVPRWRAAVNLREGWVSAFDDIAARLLLQGGYPIPEFRFDAALNFVMPTTTLAASLAGVQARLGAVSAANAAQWEIALRVADAYRLDARMAAPEFLAAVASNTSGSVAALASSVIYALQYSVGGDGSISLSGQTEKATIYAGPQVRDITTNGNFTLQAPPLDNVIVYKAGDGALSISIADPSDTPYDTLRLGAGITAAQVEVLSDSAGDLVLTDGTIGDRITIDGQLGSGYYGVQTVAFTDGSSLNRQRLADLAHTARAGNMALYRFGGGDTFTYSPGTGAVEIDERNYGLNPSNVLKLDAGITTAQIQVAADASGNTYLTDGAAGDQIKLDGETSGSYYGVQGVQFADGTTWTKAQLASMGTDGFTWTATTPGATLVGNDHVRNSFVFGPGGDTAIGGAQGNTYAFATGDGQATIVSHGTGVIKLAAGISGSDVVLQANDVGDLTITFRGDPDDSITVKGDLSQQWWGVQSQVSALTFGDGTTQAFRQSYWDQGQPMAFTSIGTASNIVLTGSNWGRTRSSSGPAATRSL